MNVKTIAVALIATLLGGAALGYWLAERRAPGAGGASHETGAAKPAPAERQVLYWYDPMRPDVKFDKPGKSPFMDMQLVPRYADDPGAAAVRIDPSVAQNLGIRTGKVEMAAIAPRLTAVGSVAFDERLLEVVQARVQGNVTRLYIKSPFERVRRGQPLADILAPEWRAAQQEYLALLDAESERAGPIRDAARERLIVLGVPEPTIRRIEETHKADTTTTVFAPADGVLTELGVREGAAFMPGAPLFRINGLGSVWVNAEVPEAQIAGIPPGSAIEATATAWPGVTFEGRVVALLPEVDRETRTMPVRIAIDNPERKLAPGMFVSLDFRAKAAEPELVVPTEAVIVTGERSVVIVARGGGGFDVAEVTTGAEARGRTAILSGLAEGQSIVLSGQFLIDSEASLNSAVNRLETQPSASEKTP
ncbi:MAG TPA: efflux RND transporter periplasmic adaptor subunit [Vicinamibacterales bacterium]|nr:efflux RND transporter periplasmic adaptor subunit [Vicinamibacterales bacterium]